MAGINKVILLGYLGKDPEIRVIENGRKVASFTLATTESYKDKSGQRVDQTEWHNISFWGPIVDVIEKYLKKGSRIYMEGKIKTRSYEDKDKVKKYFTDILGRELTMLDSAPKSGDASSTYEKNGNAVLAGESHQGEDDDLPF